MATSTAEYLPSSLSFLIANFQSFITIKIESSNYFARKSQIENALKVNCLFEYADGSLVKPPPKIQDDKGNKIPNLEFIQRQTVDRMLLSCLMATLAPPILPHAVGLLHTFEVWTKLEEKYSFLSHTHILDLKKCLYSLKKTTSMEKYLDSVKEIVQKLEVSGSHKDDVEVVFRTVNSVPEECLSLKQTIRTQCATTSLSFSVVCSMLMSKDLYLDHTQEASSYTVLLIQHPRVPNVSNSANQAGASTNHTSCPLSLQPKHSLGIFSIQLSLELRHHNLGQHLWW